MEIRKPIQLSKSVYCLLGHTNIGIIENGNDIILIDSGLNRDDAKEIDKIIQTQITLVEINIFLKNIIVKFLQQKKNQPFYKTHI